jgi:hypothetical protein
MISFSVGDFSVIDPKPHNKVQHPIVRFAVTISMDGVPWWTSKGWRIFNDRTVRPPSNGRFGKIVSFHECHPEFLALVKSLVLKISGVERELGPPEGTVVDTTKNRLIEGSAAMSEDEYGKA